MAAIPRADIYFRINEKLNSLGPQLQYSKYVYLYKLTLHSTLFYSSDNALDLYRIMDVALDKAIKEIIGPVIQRSVTIASRTTKELILKVTYCNIYVFFFSSALDICITGGFVCNMLAYLLPVGLCNGV